MSIKESPPAVDAFSRTMANRRNRRIQVHDMMAHVYASKPTLSQKKHHKTQSASDRRANPKFHFADFYDYGTYPSFGEAIAEAEAIAKADAEEDAAVVKPKPNPKPKTKKCSMMGGRRINRKSKKRNGR